MSGPEGSFSSPWYPDNYPADVQCVWEIRVAQGLLVLLTVPRLR